jgi:hypothetical protein
MPKCKKQKEGPIERLHEMGAANAGAVDILLSTSTGLLSTYAIGFTGGMLFGSDRQLLQDIVFRTESGLLHATVQSPLLCKLWGWQRKSK